MKKIIEKLLRGKQEPAPAARLILKIALALSCIILSASLLVAVYAGPLTAHTYELHYLYSELYRAPLGVLLLSSFGALLANEFFN